MTVPFNLALQEWSFVAGMNQEPISESVTTLVLDIPSLNEDRVGNRDQDGSVNINVLGGASHHTDVFLHWLCDPRIGSR